MKRLHTLLVAVSGAALFGMMVLTTADVFSRKFLTNSVTGAVEVTELLMLVMIFVALPLASLAGEHIAFDLFDRLLPPALLRWQHRLSHGLTALVFGGAAFIVWQRALRTAGVGDITSALGIRLAPWHFMASGMLAITALVHAWLAWRAVAGEREFAGGVGLGDAAPAGAGGAAPAGASPGASAGAPTERRP